MPTVHLPETMARWPSPRRINPYFPVVAEESTTWLQSFKALSPAAQRAFDRGNFGLLTALVYPTLDRTHYRIACDTMNMLFLYDDCTDDMDEASVVALFEAAMDVLLHPDKPALPTDSVLIQVIRDLWSRTVQRATTTGRRHFIDAWTLYADAVSEETRDRDQCRVRNIEEHLAFRRYTIGVEICYAMFEIDIDLPDVVYQHPLVQALRAAVVDIVLLDNDMCSYQKELRTGNEAQNILTVVMRQEHLDLEGALEWLAREHQQRVDDALSLLPQLASLTFPEETGRMLVAYVEHVVNFPRANDCWNFENERYFGDWSQVRRDRMVML
ncbi:terpenoid synthase [Trametes meyenii]|nr:terpenoid synthase [Trametes meyenii]